MLPQLFLIAGMAVAQTRDGRETYSAVRADQALCSGRNSAITGDHFVWTMIHPRVVLSFTLQLSLEIAGSFFSSRLISTSSCSECLIFPNKHMCHFNNSYMRKKLYAKHLLF